MPVKAVQESRACRCEPCTAGTELGRAECNTQTRLRREDVTKRGSVESPFRPPTRCRCLFGPDCSMGSKLLQRTWGRGRAASGICVACRSHQSSCDDSEKGERRWKSRCRFWGLAPGTPRSLGHRRCGGSGKGPGTGTRTTWTGPFDFP